MRTRLVPALALALVLGASARADAAPPQAPGAYPPPPPGPDGNPPPPSPAFNVAPNAPAADQPLVQPGTTALTFEGGAGLLGFMGAAAGVGLAWNARVTWNLSERWAVEGNYLGSFNRRPDQRSLVLTAIDGSVRFNFTRGGDFPVQPFGTVGVGWEGFAGNGGDMAVIAFPVSAGVERLLTRQIKMGARLQVRPAAGGNLGVRGAADQPGATTWALLGHLGGRF
jgi:hypothetical protein